MVAAEHLEKLQKLAYDLGAQQVAPLAARDIVVDERVRFKCLVPRCPAYGQNLMCPPHVPGPEEFRRILERYHTALMLQREIPITAGEVRDRFGEKALPNLFPQAGYEASITAHFPILYQMVETLEREAFRLGHPFAAGLTVGHCTLCPECARDGRCRHAFRARPSMEAMGINVTKTAARAGLSLQFPAPSGVAQYNYLLLID